MTTDDERWESLASEYLRALAAEDMLQWTRHWRFAERSIIGPNAEMQADDLEQDGPRLQKAHAAHLAARIFRLRIVA
jgi:hypothetical protein